MRSICFILLAGLAFDPPIEPAPAPGIVIAGGTITKIVDGDTVEVEFSRRVRVRLVDCWAPEVTARKDHPSGKALGLIAKATLESMAPVGTECTLEVATDGDDDIGDGLTFGRVAGKVWAGPEAGHLSQRMNATGQTFATKKRLEAYLTAKDLAL